MVFFRFRDREIHGLPLTYLDVNEMKDIWNFGKI